MMNQLRRRRCCCVTRGTGGSSSFMKIVSLKAAARPAKFNEQLRQRACYPRPFVCCLSVRPSRSLGRQLLHQSSWYLAGLWLSSCNVPANNSNSSNLVAAASLATSNTNNGFNTPNYYYQRRARARTHGDQLALKLNNINTTYIFKD